MKMQQQKMAERQKTPDIVTGYAQSTKALAVQKLVSDDVRVVSHSQGVVQRYVEAVLHSSLGDFRAQSQGADHRNLIHAAGLQGGNAKKIADRFMANIKPKTITDEDGNIIQENRPATQCAEPHAFGRFLERCNDDIDNDVLESLEFTSVKDYPAGAASGERDSAPGEYAAASGERDSAPGEHAASGEKDSASRGRDIRPCDVCKQWVEDKAGSPKKVLIDNITGDLDIPKSENRLRAESRARQALKNAKKRDKKKAAKARKREWEAEQKLRMRKK